jgi:hypothetical protein
MKFRLILAGMIINTGIDSLYQDMIGKEMYIKAINDLWISSYITVPFAIIGIIIAIILINVD